MEDKDPQLQNLNNNLKVIYKTAEPSKPNGSSVKIISAIKYVIVVLYSPLFSDLDADVYKLIVIRLGDRNQIVVAECSWISLSPSHF